MDGRTSQILNGHRIVVRNVLILFAVLVWRSTRLRNWGNEGGVILQPYADHVMLSSSQLYYHLAVFFHRRVT